MKFDRETMKGVVREYSGRRCQDIECPDCTFVAWGDEDATIPDGFEPVRGHSWLVQQCSEHDKPLYPWLVAASLEQAAEWLVEQSEGTRAFQVDFDAWKAFLTKH